MAVLKNASGKLFTIGGKLVTIGTTSGAGLNAYTLQTLQLPSGDQVDALVNSSDEVIITADMDLMFVWEHDIGNWPAFYQWGGTIEAPYIYTTDESGWSQKLHIFEIDGYEHQQDLDMFQTPEEKAEYICNTGRYLGTVSIDSNGCWVIESCINDLP